MSWKFNPPPGWPPQPEGWQPPPGWAPDPSWPPPPAGWQFWVAATEPAPSPPGPAVGSPVAGSPAAPTSPPAPEPAPASPAAGGGTVHEAPTTVGYPVMSPPPPGSVPTAGPTPPVGQAPTAGSAPPASYPASPSLPAYQPGSPGGGYPSGYQQPTPGAARPWHQRGWAIALAFTAVLLVGCLLGSAVALVTDSDPSASPTTAPPSPQPPATTGPGPTAEPTQQPSGDALVVGQERTGQGPAIVPLDLATGSFHILTVTYEGTGAFFSSLVDANQEYAAELASTVGENYTGTHVVELGAFSQVAAVDIEQADGEWTLLLQPLEEAEVWPDVTEGSGNTVFQVDPGTDLPTTVTGTHDGDSNFIVWAYDGEQYGNYLLINEIGQGSWEGESEMPAGTIAFSVRADGSWTIEE